MPIIEVNQVTKEFRLGELRTLRESLRNAASRLRGKPVAKRPLFKALDDVSFKVEEGEVLGIIGHNGAGKSTLLKILAGVSRPTRGDVRVRGRVAPLIELGAGLVPDLTGRENIYLNATILGMKRPEIAKNFDQIVAFAELEQFLDTPIKRYSSGMQVKLAFSVATHVESDLLIVDEVLAVGDLAFQRKCFDRMEELIKRRGKTVLLVSHNLRQVQRLCTRAILLDHGRISKDGAPTAVCDSFYEQTDAKIKANASVDRVQSRASGELELLGISLLNHEGEGTDRLSYNRDCAIHFRIQLLQPLTDVTFGFGFHTTDFLYLTTHNSEEQLRISHLEAGQHDVVCKIAHLPLLPGVYSLRFGVTAGRGARAVFYAENLKHFQVIGYIPVTVRQGFFALDARWGFGERAKAEGPVLRTVGT